MNMNESAAGPAISDFVARLQTIGLNAAGAGTVLKSILSEHPDRLLSQPEPTEKD